MTLAGIRSKIIKNKSNSSSLMSPEISGHYNRTQSEI